MKMTNNFITEISNIEQKAKMYILSMFEDNNVSELVLSSPFHFCYFNENNVPISELVKSIKTNVYSENDIVFTTTLDNVVADSLLVDSCTLPLFAKVIENEFERINIAIKEQAKKIEEENFTSSKRFFFLPDDKNPRDLTPEQFCGRAFMYGEVMTAEEYAERFNAYQLGNIHPEFGTLKMYDYTDQIIDYCPHCENEVILDSKFCKQRCPICNHLIKPCNMCADCVNPCPLGEDDK